MNDSTCIVDECARPVHIKFRGLCKVHYQRFHRTGSTDAQRVVYPTPELAFAAKTEVQADGCILWTGYTSEVGYGTLPVKGKHVMAHRFAWERENGPIPKGMVIDHLCWNRACVNVEHLRVVTTTQNNQNRKGASAVSKSGVRGVSPSTRPKGWKVHVQANGKRYHGGYFKTLEEAERVAIALRAKHMTHTQN